MSGFSVHLDKLRHVADVILPTIADRFHGLSNDFVERPSIGEDEYVSELAAALSATSATFQDKLRDASQSTTAVAESLRASVQQYAESDGQS